VLEFSPRLATEQILASKQRVDELVAKRARV
jgi:hypothetical protein